MKAPGGFKHKVHFSYRSETQQRDAKTPSNYATVFPTEWDLQQIYPTQILCHLTFGVQRFNFFFLISQSLYLKEHTVSDPFRHVKA